MLTRFVLCVVAMSATTLLCGAHAHPQGPIQQGVLAPQTWFIPPHVGGDADFKGHGPGVVLDVYLYIHPQAPNEVWASVQMDALETKHDWTRASNWGNPKHIKVATFARPITTIVTPWTFGLNPNGSRKTFQYVDDEKHTIDTFNNPCACGMFNAVHFQGDLVGREAGTRTGVLLEFNPIQAR